MATVTKGQVRKRTAEVANALNAFEKTIASATMRAQVNKKLLLDGDDDELTNPTPVPDFP
jgi:hypothetical protein